MQATRRSSQVEDLLKSTRVRDLMADKKKLVEVPCTATLGETINALVATNVVAVPVSAPPGHWLGAGGSLILEVDETTGAVCEQYIGMVTMLDILLHVADAIDEKGPSGVDPDRLMAKPVSAIIGQCSEGLSLWTLAPTTSKGTHRALIPVESHIQHAAGAELAESSTGCQMLTQMDVVNFFKANEADLKDVFSRSVGELEAVNETVFAVSNEARVIDAIKGMTTASVSAVPIVEALADPSADPREVINGRGRKVIGTFSATDLKGCPITQFQQALYLNIMEFIERVAVGPKAVSYSAGGTGTASTRVLVTCNYSTSLSGVIATVVGWNVHRVWVVDAKGLLAGVVTLTDILRAVRSIATGGES